MTPVGRHCGIRAGDNGEDRIKDSGGFRITCQDGGKRCCQADSIELFNIEYRRTIAAGKTKPLRAV